MTTEFYTGSDWEQSSGPLLSRNVINADLWPEGAPKDVLENGMHQAFAIGPIANKPHNPVGVTVTVDAVADRIVMNMAPGFIFRAYVCNITTYAQGAASAWAAALNFGDPVYVDDSDDLAAGVTLSRAPLNEDGTANPQAGWVWRCQDEEPSSGIGGANTDPFPKSFTSGSATYYLLVCVMLWPDLY